MIGDHKSKRPLTFSTDERVAGPTSQHRRHRKMRLSRLHADACSKASRFSLLSHRRVCPPLFTFINGRISAHECAHGAVQNASIINLAPKKRAAALPQNETDFVSRSCCLRVGTLGRQDGCNNLVVVTTSSRSLSSGVVGRLTTAVSPVRLVSSIIGSVVLGRGRAAAEKISDF